MWFIFGFITLISFSLYFTYKRINAAWKGEQGFTSGISYQYKILRNKHGIVGVMIGIDGPREFDYTFKKENSVDRFCKFIGLSVEHQTGNKEFDDLVYIVSDNLQLHRLISVNNKILNTVIELFKSDKKFNCELKEIRNNSGRLWLKYRTKSGFNEIQVPEISSGVVSLLQTIAGELEQIPQYAINKWKDPFVIKAAIILAISTALAINGLVHIVRLVWTRIPFIVDTKQLILDSLYWGVGIIIFLFVITLFLLGRSARTHLVMVELLFIGMFGAITTAFIEMRDMNIELDNSAATMYEVKAVNKRISRSRRSTSYHLYLEDWNKEEARKNVTVSSDFYRSVSVGDSLVVRQKSGYLKYRWVESIQKKI